MTSTSPIIPPPELVEEWANDSVPINANAIGRDWERAFATRAAQWGADQELEACCDHIRDYQWGFVDRPDGTKMHRAVDLKLARRPKSPSLKEQALMALEDGDTGPGASLTSNEVDIIRRALEALDD